MKTFAVSLVVLLSPCVLACENSFNLNQVTQNLKPIAGLPTLIETSASLSIRPLGLGLEDGWWGVKIDNLTTNLPSERLREVALLPFAFHMEEDGQIDQYKFPLVLTKSEEDYLKGFGQYFQNVSNPIDGNEYTEKELGGDFIYSYNLTKDGYTKTRVRMASEGQHPLILNYTVHDSLISVTEDSCFFSKVLGSESIEIRTQVKGFNTDIRYSYSLIKSGKNLSSSLYNLPYDIGEWVVKEVELSEVQLAEQADKLLNLLNTLNPDVTKARELAIKLGELSESLPSLDSYFENDDRGEAFDLLIFHSLSLVDNKYSQELLTKVVKNTAVSDDNRFRALQALLSGDNLIGEDASALITSILNEGIETENLMLQKTLYPSLGIAIGNRPQSEQKDQMLRIIEDRIYAEDGGTKSDLIVAAGNTGSSNFMDILDVTRTDGDVNVRRASAYSLGKMQTPEAQVMLMDMLNKESDNHTLAQVLNSVGKYKLTGDDVSAIKKVAMVSPVSYVRRNGIKALAAQGTPSSKTALKELLKTERSEQNLQLIVNGIHK